MKRHDQRDGAVQMLEAKVAAALANRDPTDPRERLDELRAGDDRQPLAHAGSGKVRRTIPSSSWRPSSRSPST